MGTWDKDRYEAEVDWFWAEYAKADAERDEAIDKINAEFDKVWGKLANAKRQSETGGNNE